MDRTGLTLRNSKKTFLNLTPKQRTFAEVYVANYPNISKKEAAKQAGYSEPTCEKWGAGFYIDRKEIKTQNLSAMSKEDLIKSIKDLNDELGEAKTIEISTDATEIIDDEGQTDK